MLFRQLQTKGYSGSYSRLTEHMKRWRTEAGAVTARLELNAEADANRRFILIEQGNTDKGDHYAKTLRCLAPSPPVVARHLPEGGSLSRLSLSAFV